MREMCCRPAAQRKRSISVATLSHAGETVRQCWLSGTWQCVVGLQETGDRWGRNSRLPAIEELIQTGPDRRDEKICSLPPGETTSPGSCTIIAGGDEK